MKIRRCERVLQETTVELSVDLPTALDRLQQLQGICRDTDSDQQVLHFICSDKGLLWIVDASRRSSVYRSYIVRGEVYVQDGVTKATVYELHDRSSKYYNIILLVISLLVYAAMLFFYLDYSALISAYNLLLLAMPTIMLVATVLRMRKLEKNKESDLIVQRNELLRRLEAVERWDD